MTAVRRPRALPAPRPSGGDGAEDLRRMVLFLETAEVLERRARRTADPAQVAVLLRRAEQRRREADALRERLAARGAALGHSHATAPSPNRSPVLRPASPGRRPER